MNPAKDEQQYKILSTHSKQNRNFKQFKTMKNYSELMWTQRAKFYSPSALRSGPQLDQGPWFGLNCGFWSQRTFQASLLKRRQHCIKLYSCKVTLYGLVSALSHACKVDFTHMTVVTRDNPFTLSPNIMFTRQTNAQTTCNSLINSGNVSVRWLNRVIKLLLPKLNELWRADHFRTYIFSICNHWHGKQFNLAAVFTLPYGKPLLLLPINITEN